MISLWDSLPCEIQEYIREIACVTLIQKTFKKNRDWYFLRQQLLKKLCKDYDGKGYRVGDRVLIKQTNKLTYGTISSISYQHNYYCRVNLLNNKSVYYYPNKAIKKDYDDIKKIILLDTWQCCMCDISKTKPSYTDKSYRCNYCILYNL